jgi:hypothetical protein
MAERRDVGFVLHEQFKMVDLSQHEVFAGSIRKPLILSLEEPAFDS